MASSSAPRVSKYDVFLSFRGEDTRKTIVSHLYAALDSRGIVTFKDDQRLEIGDHISDELRRALGSSSFAVVVLSENYATSRWCLLELQLIMELMKEGRLEVFPIFYGVDPSVVRHQLGSFALEKYQGPEMADKVLRWREALNLIANLSGVVSSHWLWSVEAGCQEIKKRLGNQRVFLVLDGVDKVSQVHALAKDKNWFGPGSRIIITTRDMGLLNTCGVEIVYEVKCLDDKDALHMFKQIAFEGGLPPDSFEQLSLRASRLAHGLPSAIQAYALFLRGRTATPKPHQNVFLHVVCLFNGDTLQRITSLLHGPIPQSSLLYRR